MSWQQLKAARLKLHAELAAAHIRSILKLIQGELLRRQQPEIVDAAAGIFNQLKTRDPRVARKIMFLVDAMLTREAMGDHATRADAIDAELQKEFEPAPLRIVLEAAIRATKRPKSVNRKPIKPILAINAAKHEQS